jgi:Domain of unknown function (DUF4123)
MTPELREQIVRALWPEGEKSRLGVWAILDCARDPKIYRALLGSRLEFRCLYSGRLPQALELVAPHLVELLPDHPLTEQIVREGWGRCWGVFAKTDDPSNLRHHLRKWLKVRDERGRHLLFRFYDPRVLRTFMPTCRPEELRRFFGPVQAWFTEGPGHGAPVEYRLDASNRLHVSPPAVRQRTARNVSS